MLNRGGFEIVGMLGRWDAKKPLGIMGLHEVLGRDYGIEEPYGGPCENDSLLSPSLHYKSPVVSHMKTPSFLTQLLYGWILVDSLWY